MSICMVGSVHTAVTKKRLLHWAGVFDFTRGRLDLLVWGLALLNYSTAFVFRFISELEDDLERTALSGI